MILATNNLPTIGTNADRRVGSATDVINYFSRRLSQTNENDETRIVDEAEILTLSGPVIVLGEPGMGKSELICELGRRIGVQTISAARFMLSKNPGRYMAAGKPLLIDGLDEAMARHEGEAVDQILAQLEAIGTPDFILSCRSREWQSRTKNNLRELYGVAPAIFTLEPLTKAEACTFLVQRYPKADPEHVLNHLDAHGISDLYANPLTLGLMGRVAETDAQLPATRAALFDRVCALIWSEHDPNRQDISLGKVAQDQALSAAGAIMASLILGGADAVSLAGPTQLQEGDIRLVDLQTLPGAEAVRAILSSKLFQTVGPDRSKPIHRVIAEFLGARWLANFATTGRRQRRLLAQLQSGGGVPASLRGLHAWIAYHSTALAKAIIAADPLGVLRYGETANLTAEQADFMLDALQDLAEIDPYFRAQDWDTHTAMGLMKPNLQAKIEVTISSPDSNAHLRSLLIEGLRDTALAGNLASPLENVILSKERFYNERHAAVLALLPHRDRSWWRGAIIHLHDQATEDSTRLARYIAEAIEYDVPDELFVAVLMAEMGMTVCPLPKIKKRRMHTIRHYENNIESLSSTRLISVLNLLSDYAPLIEKGDWQSANSLAEIVTALVVRAIKDNVVLPKDAPLLWNWLEILEKADGFHREEKKVLQELLNERDELRRAVQWHALYVDRCESTIWSAVFQMGYRMVGLAGRPKDIAWFIGQLGIHDNKDPSLREQWCDFMQVGHGRDGFDPELRAASYKFQRDDAELEAFVRKLEHPEKPAWQIKQEKDAIKREKQRQANFEKHRRLYAENRTALQSGEFGSILNPALAYLGMFRDLTSELSPQDRLAEWLGAELSVAALTGFEAVLHRQDIPSPQDVANIIPKGKVLNYCFAIMAGLVARLHAQRSFDDLRPNILTIGLLLCYEHSCINDDNELQSLTRVLENLVLSTPQDRENFTRLWVEPSLAAKSTQISALYKLANDEQWLDVGAKLATEWLLAFPDAPASIELNLIDCLIQAKAFDSLKVVSIARTSIVFPNEERAFVWLAVDVLVRFEAVQADLTGIGSEFPEFIWYLRNRLQSEQRGPTLPISTAQAKWIVSEFRAQWPYASLEGGTGTTSPWDATDFLRVMINRIANETSIEASNAMQELTTAPVDSYSDVIRHMAAEQRQKRTEENFAPLSPEGLSHLLSEGPPSNIDDLKSLVIEEFAAAQKILRGDDLDQVRDFWNDNGVPYDENRCRDRLAAIIGPELMRYDVQRITEADMPNTKRADLAFARGALQLPMEVKGQWHPNVWEAATEQLDLQYLADWRSEQRGIYCVLWFGELPSASNRRLKVPPQGLQTPTSSEAMRNMLIELIPEARRSFIEVLVLDLSAGKS